MDRLAEMTPPKRHCAWSLLLLTLALCLRMAAASAASEGAPYQLSTEVCQAVVHESGNADFTCLADRGACPDRSAPTVQWSFVSRIFLDAVPLADGKKYGIWPPLSADGSSYRSSLKIRDVVKDFDVGLVQCIVSCGNDVNSSLSGGLRSASTVPPPPIMLSVELCTLNLPTGIVFCGSSTADGHCMSAFSGNVCDKRCDSEANHYGGGNCRRDAGVPRMPLPLDSGGAATIAGGGFAAARSESQSDPLDAGATCAADVEAFDHVEQRSIVLLLSTEGDDRLEETAAAQVQRAMASELNTPLCRAELTTGWSLGAASSAGLVLYYLNSSLFIQGHNRSGSHVKLRFFLKPKDCQPDASCFGEADNAAKYLANRLIFSSRRSWGANVAGIGVSTLKRKCEARYGADEQLMPFNADGIASRQELRPLDVVSIVGLVLGVASGALLVAGLSYTAVCWRRTYGKGPHMDDGDEQEAAATASDRSLLPQTQGSQPTSLATVASGSECDEAQALLLRTFAIRQAYEPGVACTTTPSGVIATVDELFTATAVP